MKTELQKNLAKIASSIQIRTIWSHDPDCLDIRKDCDGLEDADPEDWQAWQSEIEVSTILNGELVSESAYLGGTWEKAGDLPEYSNPDISGYEPQMTVEALEGLLKIVSGAGSQLKTEIQAAIEHTQSAE